MSMDSFTLSQPGEIEMTLKRLMYFAECQMSKPSCIVMGTATYAQFCIEMQQHAMFETLSPVTKYFDMAIHVVPLSRFLELGYADWRGADTIQQHRIVDGIQT